MGTKELEEVLHSAIFLANDLTPSHAMASGVAQALVAKAVEDLEPADVRSSLVKLYSQKMAAIRKLANPS